MNKLPARAAAAKLVSAVIDQGRSLSQVLDEIDAHPDRALTRALIFETLRWQHRYAVVRDKLMRKPHSNANLNALLIVGMTELGEFDTADYASVNETVSACKALNLDRAKGLVNGVLRTFQREREKLHNDLQQDMRYRWSHPGWLQKRLRKDWPNQADAILDANNQRPSMSLRINRQRSAVAEYLNELNQAGIHASAGQVSADAVVLDEPVDVSKLPDFGAGHASVQDEAAQLAAQLLDAKTGQRVLDACAAPGGKTAHILERGQNLDVLAIDRDPKRLRLVHATLQRLGLNARTVAGDAGDPDVLCGEAPFDRILLDAPCSATGVIRRHPDIKTLRQPQDITKLADEQARLLQALWPILKPGGIMLYATCSVLQAENQLQMESFLGHTPDATAIPIDATWGIKAGPGRQIFPDQQGMDGFFYTLLKKHT